MSEKEDAHGYARLQRQIEALLDKVGWRKTDLARHMGLSTDSGLSTLRMALSDSPRTRLYRPQMLEEARDLLLDELAALKEFKDARRAA